MEKQSNAPSLVGDQVDKEIGLLFFFSSVTHAINLASSFQHVSPVDSF
jgi:hypothetical protein